ncbi:MAG: hypothetical protein U0736_07690 [Gemmataceae bacterium]
MLIYHDTRLPEELRGLLLCPDTARGLIRAYHVEPVTASFRLAEEFEFLSAPKDAGFRPAQMAVGPDGAVYVLDAGAKGAGRLLRVRWAGSRRAAGAAAAAGGQPGPRWRRRRTTS